MAGWLLGGGAAVSVGPVLGGFAPPLFLYKVETEFWRELWRVWYRGAFRIKLFSKSPTFSDVLGTGGEEGLAAPGSPSPFVCFDTYDEQGAVNLIMVKQYSPWKKKRCHLNKFSSSLLTLSAMSAGAVVSSSSLMPPPPPEVAPPFPGATFCQRDVRGLNC